jgi:hypothetical protein
MKNLPHLQHIIHDCYIFIFTIFLYTFLIEGIPQAYRSQMRNWEKNMERNGGAVAAAAFWEGREGRNDAL